MTAPDSLLVMSLAVAVPMWADHWKDAWPEVRADRARRCGDAVAAHGDNILYRSKASGKRGTESWKPGTAEGFNRLAEGIGIASLQPGGMNIFGQHFHHGCPATTLDDCVDLKQDPAA